MGFKSFGYTQGCEHEIDGVRYFVPFPTKSEEAYRPVSEAYRIVKDNPETETLVGVRTTDSKLIRKLRNALIADSIDDAVAMMTDDEVLDEAPIQ